MSANDRWRRVRDLFERALDEHPADLGGWLDQEGVVDWQLREEVLSLMQHHEKAGSFLVEAAGDRLPDMMSDRSLDPAQVIGSYTIVREIGRGGMGRVYLARDERLGRMVALKAVSPELTADPSYRDRLRREARVAAGLTHPGICTVFALEELEGELFIAAEFVDGHTLREEIESGRAPTADEVMRTARGLAAALAHAHGRGITHRDLKPENIMRARDGQLKILDFGLARILASTAEIDGTLTRPGAIIGTPRYMAPEQLTGQPTDARTDVFAFGVLLYEYACGAHPFDAATPLALVARVLESDASAIDERCPHLPSGLARVIDRCLRKSPAERFASAADIVRALENVDEVRPVRRMTPWWRTHQLVLVALYFLACALTWQIKEWQPGAPTAIFVAVCIAATVAGVFRGHLVFTERVHGAGLAAQLRRAVPMTFVADVFLALALAADGVILAATRPLPAVLTIGLGVGLALARLIVEPATTSASFE